MVAAQWRATPKAREKPLLPKKKKKKKTAEVLLKKGNIYVGTTEKKD